MNKNQKLVVDLLIHHKEYYLVFKSNDLFRGPGYNLCSSEAATYCFVPQITASIIIPLLKKCGHEKYNLNLNKLRRLHGNSYIKKQYLSFLKTTKANGS